MRLAIHPPVPSALPHWAVTALVVAMGCAADELATPDPTAPTARPPEAALSITPNSVVFGAIGSSVTLAATVRDRDGVVIRDAPVRWSLGGTHVATIDSTGRLVAVANGEDTVRAAAADLVATAVVRVAQVAVAASVTVPDTLTRAGATAVLTGEFIDSGGTPLSAPVPSWISSDPSVLSVEPDGRATAVAHGTAIVTARLGVLDAVGAVTVDLSGPLGPPLTGAVVPCEAGAAGPFPCDGIDLLAYLPIQALGGAPGVALNDVWGWTDTTTGRDYALVGRTDGVSFVDVTDPSRPTLVGTLSRTARTPSSVWRDVKVYTHHAFIVADGAEQHGVQVFDLRRLRGAHAAPATFAETAHYDGVASVHNIVVNERSGFAYAVGSRGGGTTCGGGLHVIDVRSPTTPVFAGCFADPLTGRSGTGYTHDAQCVRYTGPDPDYRDHEICFGANETALSIADVTDKSTPFGIARATDPNVGYTHQGWLTEDQRYFFADDELDELQVGGLTRTLVWDVTDLDDPILAAEHFGPTRATDHNLYIRGTRLYQSNYRSGVRVLDITDPLSPAEVGFFDTAPTESDVPGFGGAWSNYPFFAADILVVTSEREGLFVLGRPDDGGGP